MRAYCLIRAEPHYRADAFCSGLRAVGFHVEQGAPRDFRAGDVVVGWNRYGGNVPIANAVEAAGGVYLCAENGYIGVGGASPHHMKVRDPYAIARGWHNDESVVRMGQGDRWDALHAFVAPWRADGEHVLVCPNRPFGAPGRAMPENWANDVRKRLEQVTRRPIRVRGHPGNNAPAKPLAEDLADAWVCVIWSSSAGVHALVAGVPVFCEAPFWICKSAAEENLRYIERPLTHSEDTRLRAVAFQRLAYAQWSIEEISSGEPFRRLLFPAREAEVEASA